MQEWSWGVSGREVVTVKEEEEGDEGGFGKGDVCCMGRRMWGVAAPPQLLCREVEGMGTVGKAWGGCGK